MPIDKESAEYNLGLLRGHAIGSRNKDVIAAADFVESCFGDSEDEGGGTEESEIEPRKGRWQQDELQELRDLIEAGNDDDVIVETLSKYGRKEAAILSKIAEIKDE